MIAIKLLFPHQAMSAQTSDIIRELKTALKELLYSCVRASTFAVGTAFVVLHFKSGIASTIEWTTGNVLLILGAVLLALAASWSSFKNWLSWQKNSRLYSRQFFVIRLIAIAGLFYYFYEIIAESFDTISVVIGSFLIGISLGFIWQIKKPAKKTLMPSHDDSYHRGHLVEQLADFLINQSKDSPESPRRIGILGAWGSGKTTVMRLLEAKLSQKGESKDCPQFKIKWVNPWRSNSQNEAWTEISRGINQALGFPRFFPRTFFNKIGFDALSRFIPDPIGGPLRDLNTLLSTDGDRADEISRGLANYLKTKNQRLLILFDDMERISADQLRKIFPVIDRLGSIKNCYFIFALDPDRIQRAFEGVKDPTSEAQGYLDKVLDLQLDLPEVSKDEAYANLEELIDSDRCPKFKAALPRLKPYLPLNPRQLSQLARHGQAIECMFLGRYGPDEHHYEGFFLVRILEIQFPQIYRYLTNFAIPLGDIDISMMSRLHSRNSFVPEIINKIERGIPEAKAELSTHNREFLESLLSRLCETTDTLQGSKCLDTRFAVTGYRKRIQLTYSERQDFLKAWRSYAGTVPFRMMIPRSIGKVSNLPRALKEVFEIEIEALEHEARGVSYMTREPDAASGQWINVLSKLSLIQKHADFIHSNFQHTEDRQVFDYDLFKRWLKLVSLFIQLSLPEDREIENALSRITEKWSQLLPTIDLHQFTRTDYPQHLNEISEPKRGTFENILASTLGSARSTLRDAMLSGLRTESLQDRNPNRAQSILEFGNFDEPETWLMTNDHEASKALTALAEEAPTNKILQQNFITLCSHLLDNYETRKYPLSNNTSRELRDKTRSFVNKHPYYLPAIWRGALEATNPPQPTADLARLRNSAIYAERFDDSKQSILRILEQLEPSITHSGDPSETGNSLSD
jgi:hypothetical protein